MQSGQLRRREFITLLGGAAVAWPMEAGAQQPERLVLLGSGAAQSSNIFVEALKQGLADNGLIEGKAYVLDVRSAEGEYGRFPALAADAVKQNPSLIIATTIAAVHAAQRASSTIPIVMTTINDPVGAGLVASLARPGGNTTGIADLSEDVTPKVLEILRMIIPTATRIAALFNSANPSNLSMLDKVHAYARSIGTMVQPAEVRAPGELEREFGAIIGLRPDALLVINTEPLAFDDVRHGREDRAQFGARRRPGGLGLRQCGSGREDEASGNSKHHAEPRLPIHPITTRTSSSRPNAISAAPSILEPIVIGRDGASTRCFLVRRSPPGAGTPPRGRCLNSSSDMVPVNITTSTGNLSGRKWLLKKCTVNRNTTARNASSPWKIVATLKTQPGRNAAEEAGQPHASGR